MALLVFISELVERFEEHRDQYRSGKYNMLALQWKVSAGTQVLYAAALLAVLAWVNILGVVWGGRLQFVTTAIKADFLALVVLLPWVMLPLDEHGLAWSNYTMTVTPRLPSLSAQIGAVLLAVLWAYDGWHGRIGTLSGSYRQSGRRPVFMRGEAV